MLLNMLATIMHAQIITSIAIVLLLGLVVGPIVSFTAKKCKPGPPAAIPVEQWEGILGRGSGSTLLGYLERLFYLASFWLNAPILIAGWLAFKVASAWHVWNYIIQFPKELDGVDEIEYLIARRQIGSWVFHPFLTGTLLNILVGLLSVILSKSLF